MSEDPEEEQARLGLMNAVKQKHMASDSAPFRITNPNMSSGDYKRWLVSMGRQPPNNDSRQSIDDPRQFFDASDFHSVSNPVVIHQQPALDKRSEVERIKQQLLDYQREIEAMQKQREYNKLIKQQKLEQQKLEQEKMALRNELSPRFPKENTVDPTEEYENHRNGAEQAEDEEEGDEDDEDMRRFDRPNAELNQHHHHHKIPQHQRHFEENLKNNQIQETAIHSKPANYHHYQQLPKPTNGNHSDNNNKSQIFHKLYQMNKIDAHTPSNGYSSVQHHFNDAFDDHSENDDDEFEVDGQEYNLSTYQTHNLISKKSKVNHPSDADQSSSTVDVTNLINQLKLINNTNSSQYPHINTTAPSTAAIAKQ